MAGKRKSGRQSLANLRGEIEFRSKLSRQHVTGEVLLPDYYKKVEHDSILLERVKATSRRMKQLADIGVTFSPFLELGAERGQRSLVLANDFGATGIAVDISYHQLKTMEYFGQLFDYAKLPVRICCDANHLPFKSNTFRFLFCYQFLHHFPHLSPIVRELHRVLGDGYFYFDEEPFKRILKLNLYTQKDKIYSARSLKKHRYIRLLESFLSEERSDEVDHGVIENHNIPLVEWMDALSVFDEREVRLISIRGVASQLDERVRLRNIPNALLGGTIAGLCRKKSDGEELRQFSIDDLLGCPDCTIPVLSGGFDRPPLSETPHGWRCSLCGFTYPCRDGIRFLLPRSELRQLYPDLQ